MWRSSRVMAFAALSFLRPCEASARAGKNHAWCPPSRAALSRVLVPGETPAQHRAKAQAIRQGLLRMRRGPPTRPCRDNSVCICDRSRNDRVRCVRAEQPSFYSSQCSSLRRRKLTSDRRSPSAADLATAPCEPGWQPRSCRRRRREDCRGGPASHSESLGMKGPKTFNRLNLKMVRKGGPVPTAGPLPASLKRPSRPGIQRV